MSTHAFLLGNGQTYATLGVPYYRVSRIFMSRSFHPCKLVPQIHVWDFPPLQHGAAFSCPASSCLAFSASPRKSQKHRLESDSSLESLTRVPNSAFLAHPVTTTTTTVSGEKSYKFEEILPIFKAVSSNPDNNPGTLAEFLEAFKTFDREGQGYINGAELRHVLKSLGTRGLVLRCTHVAWSACLSVHRRSFQGGLVASPQTLDRGQYFALILFKLYDTR